MILARLFLNCVRVCTYFIVVAVGAVGQASVIHDGVAGQAVASSVELDLAVGGICGEEEEGRKFNNKRIKSAERVAVVFAK